MMSQVRMHRLVLVGLVLALTGHGREAGASGRLAASFGQDWQFQRIFGENQLSGIDWLVPWDPLEAGMDPGASRTEVREDPVPVVTPSEITGTPGREGSDLGCLALISAEGLTFELAPPTEGIATPVRLSTESIGGVRFVHYYGNRTPWVFDCRLALALARAAPVLRSSGVVQVIFASHYRPSFGTLRPGKYHYHSQGLAIDIKGFRLDGGMRLDVAMDYEAGLGFMESSSCLGRPLTPKGLLLRKIVCDLDEADVFETILTPDYDEVHWNHFHFSAFHPMQRSLFRARGTALLEVPLSALPDWALARSSRQRPEERSWDFVALRPLEPDQLELLRSLGIPLEAGPPEIAALLAGEPMEIVSFLALISANLKEGVAPLLDAIGFRTWPVTPGEVD